MISCSDSHYQTHRGSTGYKDDFNLNIKVSVDILIVESKIERPILAARHVNGAMIDAIFKMVSPTWERNLKKAFIFRWPRCERFYTLQRLFRLGKLSKDQVCRGLEDPDSVSTLHNDSKRLNIGGDENFDCMREFSFVTCTFYLSKICRNKKRDVYR